jgi:hypothetical protein
LCSSLDNEKGAAAGEGAFTVAGPGSDEGWESSSFEVPKSRSPDVPVTAVLRSSSREKVKENTTEG